MSLQTLSPQSSAPQLSCPQCSRPHPVWTCDEFKQLHPSERLKTVYRAKLCKRCLRSGHFQDKCKSNLKCKACGRLHNPLLHMTPSKRSSFLNQSPQTGAADQKGPEPVGAAEANDQIKINTAMTRNGPRDRFKVISVLVSGTYGPISANAFLDSGSDTTLCSSQLPRRLGFHEGKG